MLSAPLHRLRAFSLRTRGEPASAHFLRELALRSDSLRVLHTAKPNARAAADHRRAWHSVSHSSKWILQASACGHTRASWHICFMTIALATICDARKCATRACPQVIPSSDRRTYVLELLVPRCSLQVSGRRAPDAVSPGSPRYLPQLLHKPRFHAKAVSLTSVVGSNQPETS